MKCIAVFALLGMLCIAASAQEYQFEGNVSIPDPDGALSFRKTWMVHNSIQKWVGFRSINFHLDNDSLDIDTLGGFISYDSIPFAIMGYYELDADWDEDSFNVDSGAFKLSCKGTRFASVDCQI